jgi:hypothetical protein
MVPFFRTLLEEHSGVLKMTDPEVETQKLGLAKRPLFTHIWTAIKKWLRRDGIAIVLYLIATLLISYPLAFKLGQPWLATRDTDTFLKLWDNWWLQNLAFREPSLFFTDSLFHPRGLDLSHHSISWTVAFLSWGLTAFTDAITAYNLTILIAIFSTAYAAYLLARPFVRYGAAAWLAGAIYSFAPYHIAHSGGHPDLVHLAPIPLAVLLLYMAISRSSVLAAMGAALMVGFAAFTSLYIMVFTLLTIGPVLIFLLLDRRRWSEKQVWRSVVLFGLVSALLLSIRLVPIFRDVSALTEAIEAKYSVTQNQTDLLSYILPSQLNPLFTSYTLDIASRLGDMSSRWPAYLGVVPLVLIIVALLWKERRKAVMLWLIIGLIFVFLSLGPVLRFNGNVYENIVMPAQYLSWFPPIRAVGRPDFFVLGVLLPVAMLAAYGFDRILLALDGRRTIQVALSFLLPALLLLEYWSGEFPGIIPNVNPFYEQLSTQSDDTAIIQLPMGRTASKRYMFLQTYHQQPIVEGLSARTPVDAYQYIHNNPILLNWLENTPLDCDILNWEQMVPAINQLVDDDIRYVVVHHQDDKVPDLYADYLPVDPVYQDSDLSAFNLVDLRYQPPCPTTYERVMDPPSPGISRFIAWEEKISLLGYDLPDIEPDATLLPIKLYWQAHSRMDASFVAYFHLVDLETGSLVAQADVIPRGWSYPTTLWEKDEVVEDSIQIPLENVPPGKYELRIGWYDSETGARLRPDSDEAQPSSDGSSILTVIDR